ncbi:MAG TPA: methyltransferase domain-containing protein [Solirubrobacteraceae bacterium]|nr:methyltransferase domain-containing protein [Solirubrobacteraceae bacterium]
MPLHPLAENFAAVADAYERGRPEYPPAAVGALAAELGLAPGARVLDLAAGTGKLTRALLAAGLDVVAVEPQAPLREKLIGIAGAERVLDGFAERIPLPDASLDAVTVADAIHWFDHAAAFAEMHRVLRAGAGGLAVLTTIPDWSGASWAGELGSMLGALRPEHPQFEGPPWQQALRDSGAWSEPREIRVTASRPVSPERLRDHIESFSWVAAMPGGERGELLAKAEATMRAGQTPAEMPFHVAIGLARPL